MLATTLILTLLSRHPLWHGHLLALCTSNKSLLIHPTLLSSEYYILLTLNFIKFLVALYRYCKATFTEFYYLSRLTSIECLRLNIPQQKALPGTLSPSQSW